MWQVAVEHLASIEAVQVKSESLYCTLEDLFEKHEIPWSNVISLLLDSCNVMWGSTNGVGTRIRTILAPQLVDIDRVVCHHIHNASKGFTTPFDQYRERLYTDLHNDHKHSADLKANLSEICDLLGIKFTVPDQFIPHHLLSTYDATFRSMRICNPYIVFYYSFLKEKDRMLYLPVVHEI